MKFTIVTVCLNCVKTIEKTILSVINQSYGDVEYIIIDGNSTDGTQDIIRKYESNIAYWISEPDKGIYDAMNKGIEKSSGDIIAFINSGDRYVDGALEYVADYFENDSLTQILCCEVDIEESGFIRKRNNALMNTPQNILLGYMIYCHQGVFAQKGVFEKYGSFSTKYKIASDYEWLLDAYSHGTNIRYSKFTTTIFLSGGISTTQWMRLVSESYQIASNNAKKLLDEREISTSEYEKLRDQIQRTASIRYIKAVVFEEIPINKQKVNKEMLKQLFVYNKCSIFGAGVFGKICFRILMELGIEVECFWDNAEKKWGSCIEDVPIRNPKEICVSDTPVIIALQFYAGEIAGQLQKMGLQEKKNFLGAEVIFDIIKGSLQLSLE